MKMYWEKLAEELIQGCLNANLWQRNFNKTDAFWYAEVNISSASEPELEVET